MADVAVEFGAKLDELDAGVNEAKAKIAELKESADQVSESFKKVAEVFGIAFSVDKIVEFVKSMGELGESVERMGAMLGVSNASVLQMEGVAKLTGTSMEALALSVERMSLNIQHSTRDTFNPTAQALHNLGLNAKELIGLPADQYFLKVAEAASKFSASLNLTNNIMQIGGRGIAQMIPELLKGGEGYAELKRRVDEANGAIDKQIPGMAATNENMNILSLATRSLGAQLFTTFKPAIDGVVSTLTEMVKWMRDAIAQGGAMGTIFTGLANVAKGLATALAVLVSSFEALIATVGLGAALIAGEGEKAWTAWGKGLEGVYSGWKKTFDAIWHDAHILHVEVGEKLTAPPIDVGAQSQLQARLKDLDALIEKSKSYYEQLKIFEQTAVVTSKATEREKMDVLLGALSQRETTVREVYRRELELARGNAAIEADIRKKESAELEAILKNRLEVQADYIKKNTQEWESALGGLTGAFNTQLRGLLSGTVTWAQAMKNITADLVIKMIEEFEKLAIVKPLAGMLSSIMSAPSELFASFVKIITGMFGPLEAGFTSWFAPTLGPGAPAAGAAAASAEVAAAAATVGKFELGTDYVPRTGLAMVHEGEAIIPASQNAAGAGGATFNFSISAWDGVSVQQWLRAGGGQTIARHVTAVLNANPTTRLAY